MTRLLGRAGRLRGGAPGRVGGGPRLPAGRCAGRSWRWPRPGTGWWSPAARRAAADRRGRRAPALDLGGRTSLAELAAVIAGAAAWWSATPGRPTSPPRSAPRWSPVRPDRPGRPVGSLPGAARPPRRPGRRLPGHPGRPLPGAGPPVPVASVTAAEVVAAVDQARSGRVNILLWHVHGSWTTSFVQGKHRYLCRSRPPRPVGGGRARTLDWPASVGEVTPRRCTTSPSTW